MPKIQVLDIQTANRIAAGEVVERPASAAKELIENAVDAGSSAVTIEIRQGGIEYLRVTDNGAGLPPGELRIAFERHATSKIRSGDALDAIETLGFRGEALASIAAVSRVEMLSRQKGAEMGMRIEIEGGNVLSLREAGCPEGTTVVIRDLFFNTPARLKFLKRPATEAGHVGDTVLTQALANPSVSFRFVNNSKSAFHTPGDGDVRKTLAALFGREIERQLMAVEGEFSPYRLNGAIGLQDAARAGRQHEFFIVNGRYVRSPLLASALEEAVKGHILIGRYPMAALYLQCPAHLVDVNVHPNKLEVRFGDEAAVRAGVMEAVQSAMSPRAQGEAAVPLLAPSKAQEKQRPAPRVEGVTDVSRLLKPPSARPITYRAAESDGPPPLPPMPTLADAPPPRASYRAGLDDTMQRAAMPDPAPQPVLELAAEPSPPAIVEEIALPLPPAPPRMLGVLFQTYALAQQGEDFLLVDQHAAHERLLYDNFLSLLNSGQVQSQGLLLPMQISATPAEAALLRESIGLLNDMGFALEEFGPNAFRVDAVPHVLGEPQLREFFDELLSSLERIGTAGVLTQKRDAIAAVACKRAVKAGDNLTERELSTLLEKALDGASSLTCPHGRPILLRISRAELERRFRRIQP